MRRATEADVPDIAAYLEARLVKAMFPLGNLLTHGLGEGHPHAMTFWLDEADGALAGVLGQTTHGIVLPAHAAPDMDAVRAALDGRGITGIVGPAGEARALERGLSLVDAPRTLDEDEPHLELALGELRVPDGSGHLRPADEAPEATLRDWMADYHRAALSTPEHLVAENVDRWYHNAVQNSSHRVLMDGATPLALTGLNARAAGMVQVGGVYTPPPLRGRGHARRAVALDLLAAREDGATGAALFASGPSALAAYAAIGFRRIGSWTLVLFDGPQHV